jgi:hypothetical protein
MITLCTLNEFNLGLAIIAALTHQIPHGLLAVDGSMFILNSAGLILNVVNGRFEQESAVSHTANN